MKFGEIYPLDESNERVIAFKKKYGLDGKFVIMYSGNIGLYYDLENLIKVVEKIKPGTKTADGREVVFAFVGAGSVLDKLVLYVKEHHIKHGGRYPELLLRIFRTGKASCEMKIMDEHMILSEGTTIEFKHDLIDNNQKDLEWWTAKHNWYSNREVLDHQMTLENAMDESLEQDGTSSGQAKMKRVVKNSGYYRLPKFFRAHLYFIYRYYIKLGFLDGPEGKIFHFLQAYWYRFLVDAKIYECEKKGTKMKPQGDLKA